MKPDSNVEIESSIISPLDGSIKFVFRKSALCFEGCFPRNRGAQLKHSWRPTLVKRILRSLTWFPVLVTLSYLLFDGVNDSELHADALARLASPQYHSIQILLYNDIDDAQFGRVSDAKADRFERTMRDHGFFAYIQRSQGRDIGGGCNLKRHGEACGFYGEKVDDY